MAFRSNLFGSITHRGGRDARVPVRRRFVANLCGTARRNRPAVGYQPYVLAIRIGDPAVGEYADAIHQEIPAVGCPPYVANMSASTLTRKVVMRL
ncbi:MAG: hypothetical protein LBQ66_12430 [Planctomycetaceae bacterium]|nr:hypothetical protein [Planctomycetaceae bacterium]